MPFLSPNQQRQSTEGKFLGGEANREKKKKKELGKNEKKKMRGRDGTRGQRERKGESGEKGNK